MFTVNRPLEICGRRLRPGDSLLAYPGAGIRAVLDLAPNYGAVLGAAIEGPLELVTPSSDLPEFATAVGLESPAPSQRPQRTSPRWGARIRRQSLRVVR